MEVGTYLTVIHHFQDAMRNHISSAMYYYDSLDNNEREQLILVVVVDAPERNIHNMVEILSNCKTEMNVLFLRRGDGYAMNGKMQKYYTHGVPEAATKWAKPVTELQLRPRSRRNSVISASYFDTEDRRCTWKIQQAVYCDKWPWFGRSLCGLYEGWLYSRSDIWHIGAHVSQQKGVKVNKMDSCNAIVVAGKGDVKGKDTVLKLMYLSSTSTKEANGMIISHKKDLVLRVFLMDNDNHVHWAVVPSNAFYKKISGTY